MVDVLCPECGAQNWLENQTRCLRCSAILRRCQDCANYSPQVETCGKYDVEIEEGEAQRPTALAASVSCAFYRPVPQRRAA